MGRPSEKGKSEDLPDLVVFQSFREEKQGIRWLKSTAFTQDFPFKE